MCHFVLLIQHSFSIEELSKPRAGTIVFHSNPSHGQRSFSSSHTSLLCRFSRQAVTKIVGRTAINVVHETCPPPAMLGPIRLKPNPGATLRDSTRKITNQALLLLNPFRSKD